jgi:hypothetical protein
MNYAYDFLGICSGLALLLAFILLLRRPYRQFWVFLVYVAWELLSTTALTSFNVLFSGPADAGNGVHAAAVKWYARLYWTNDVIIDLFRFVLLMVLTYWAVPEGAKRISLGRILGGVVAVVVVLPFLVFPAGSQPWPDGAWFNSTSELLNFGAAIMNLVLWGALLGNPKRDARIVALSAGLGVVVTGAAAAYGLRHLIPSQALFIPNLFLMLTQILGWTIWCRLFWPAQNHGPALNAATNKAVPSA